MDWFAVVTEEHLWWGLAILHLFYYHTHSELCKVLFLAL